MRYSYDELARLLAEADEQTWGCLTTDERDRYRAMAEAAAFYFEGKSWERVA